MLVPWSVATSLALLVGSARAAELADVEQLYRSGQYAQCAAAAGEEIATGDYREEWRRLKIESELAEGQYAAALASAEEAVSTFPASISLRLLARRAYLYNGQTGRAATQLGLIERFALNDPQAYASAEHRVALGRFFLLRGADARQVLEVFYDPVVRQAPEYVEAHLATAELALEKGDLALAGKTLAAAPKAARADPEFHYLSAKAYLEDDAAAAEKSLAAALAINPRHVASLLVQVDAQVDAEDYDGALQTLNKIAAINPREPLAWAYRAVLAHIDGDDHREREARDEALKPWPTNPEVDHTIGRKLSEKYRFAEGAEYQRRALKFDADFLPARMQLAQDLLRLGREDEGWKLADGVFAADGYNVVAHNLVTLRDNVKDYRLLTSDGFRLKLDAREAALYGDEALQLLERARRTLGEKYEVEHDEPVTVEIFAQQRDFAVRTFGLPGAEGFLGVCFGNVITANSPAALGGASANWQSVLWHEYCHVVTLRKTQNKMPRWLSEGISVYEERQANPAWGQSMTPEYRARILAGRLTPVSQLSSAFLAPESPQDLQFAYFESSLVVQYLIERYGLDALKELLDDLGGAMPMNEALVRHFAPLARLDAEFADYARRQAESLAPQLNWEDSPLAPDATSQELADLLEARPDNFATLVALVQALVREQKWAPAIEHARRLRTLYPEFVGSGHAYEALAVAYRATGDAEAEREALEAWAERDAEAVEANERLMELCSAAEDWPAVERSARRSLAVNPLAPTPHRWLAKAAEKLGAPATAIWAYRALLQFDSTDEVEVRYRLAQLLHGRGDDSAARRDVLRALEEAPRFLAAHRLLLELPVDDPKLKSTKK